MGKGGQSCAEAGPASRGHGPLEPAAAQEQGDRDPQDVGAPSCSRKGAQRCRGRCRQWPEGDGYPDERGRLQRPEAQGGEEPPRGHRGHGGDREGHGRKDRQQRQAEAAAA
eukprot:6384063-Alexandrium_andersonii.AAC.1